jgi:hypothetical protein
MPEHAFEILSDQLTRSLIGADFEGYCAVMELPLSIVTQGGSAYVLNSKPDLRNDFDTYTQALTAYRVTDIYRQSISLDQPSPEEAVITCRMHIMTKAQRIVDPFEARFHLHLTPQGWLFRQIERSNNSFVKTLGKPAQGSDSPFSPTEET